MKSTNMRPEPESTTTTTTTTTTASSKLPVKLEIEDSLEEEHGPLNKRSKPSQSFQEVLNFKIFFFFLAWLFGFGENVGNGEKIVRLSQS